MKYLIKLPEKVNTIIETLQEAGFEAYIVGGCVRDSLLQKEPVDWDITTSAKPEQVKSLFRRTVDTGILHGTVTVMLGADGYEVTTYRIDGEYEDARHPKEVTFTSQLVEDLKRRDFTINAMAYNPIHGLVDEFQGIQDLEQGIIRCVGNASERFQEDALRMMRAIRFAAQLQYQIETSTWQAICELKQNLSRISGERIQIELVKTLLSPNPDYFLKFYETGITSVIMPEFDAIMETLQNNPHHCYTVGEHTLKTLSAVKADKVLRYTMLFHDLGKAMVRTTDKNGIDHFYGHEEHSRKMAEQILRRLKSDGDTIRKVTKLVKYHDLRLQPVPYQVRKAVHQVGEDIFPLLFPVMEADISAQSNYCREEKMFILNQVKQVYQNIIDQKDCLSIQELALSGHDLQKLGMKPGKEMGEMLAAMLEEVLKNPEHNQTDYLINFYKNRVKHIE